MRTPCRTCTKRRAYWQADTIRASPSSSISLATQSGRPQLVHILSDTIRPTPTRPYHYRHNQGNPNSSISLATQSGQPQLVHINIHTIRATPTRPYHYPHNQGNPNSSISLLTQSGQPQLVHIISHKIRATQLVHIIIHTIRATPTRPYHYHRYLSLQQGKIVNVLFGLCHCIT